MDWKVRLCDGVTKVGEFARLGDRESAGGRCVAAMTTRTRCGWFMFGECGEVLYGRRFPLWLKGAVYESYVWPV